MTRPKGGGNRTRQLIILARGGDVGARNELIERNLPLVRAVASRFTYGSTSFDDLFQVGCIGLMKAIDRFDPAYDVTLSTYAVPFIMGDIRRYLRTDRPLKVTRTVHDMYRHVASVREQFVRRHGREPTLSDIEKETGLSREDIAMASDAMRDPVRLDAVVTFGDDAEMRREPVADPGPNINEVLALRQMLTRLAPDERQVIYWRYFKRLSQVETAEKMNCSQATVSRLEQRAKGMLRSLLVR